MISKAKALYQVKLILECLPKEEYDLISDETIDYIEQNYEYDENFKLYPNKPLEEQNIDDKAYEMLDKLVAEAERRKVLIQNSEVNAYVEKVKYENEEFDTKVENIRLKTLVKKLRKENEKIPKAKMLLTEYKNALDEKEKEIKKLKREKEEIIKKIPKTLRKKFLKNVV